MLALISLDATSVPLLDRMRAEGRLPQLAELRQRGKLCAFESTPFPASVYPSVCTGLSLSDHGAYYPFQWSAAEQRVRLAEDLLPQESIFDRLTRAGKRMCVLDPTDCSPQQFASGIAVSGWQFESRLFLPKWSQPASIHHMLTRIHGPAVRWNETFGKTSEARLCALRKLLATAPARITTAVETLMLQEPFDLLWVNFVAAHLAGHRLWDQTAALEEVMAAVDAALGQLLARLPDDAAVVVFSPKPMGPDTSRVDLLPQMLARVMGATVDSGSTGLGPGALWRLRALVPTEARERLAALMPDRVALDLTARLETFRVDWRKTCAFTLPSDGAGFVRLNLKGRERDGIVDPADKDRLLEDITAGLLTFNDMGGGPAIRAVLRPAEFLEPGKRLDRLPDLILLWSETLIDGCHGVTSPEFGAVPRPGVGSGRSGDHVGDTWAIVLPGAHRLAAGEWGTVRAVDLSATVCSVLGLPHDDLVGRPLLQ